MSAIRKVLSPILTFLLEPLVCRIADRLNPSMATLQLKLEEVEKGLTSPFLPVIIKNEAQNISSLPLALLKDLPGLSVVGYYAEDIAPLLPGCTVLPAARWLSGCRCHEEMVMPPNLLFLDEYYFHRSMQRLFSPLAAVGGCLVFPTRFEYLPEQRCRTVLHQIGFMEVALATCESQTGEIATYAVTHAGPVSGHPVHLDDSRPPAEPLSPAIWLIARKVPSFGAPVSFNGFDDA